MTEKSKILVIDDEADFCHFLKLNMELTGEFEVVTAGEGKAGIDLTMTFKPDLILLDLRMPGMSGSEILSALKQDHLTKDTPVIFLTGLAIKEDEQEDALKKAGHIFITKPVTTTEIISQIKPVLGRK